MVKSTLGNQKFVVSNFDDILLTVNNDIVRLQVLLLSPYNRLFEEQIRLWHRNLKIINDVVEEWMKFQRAFIFITPVFDSVEIHQQLPNELKKYQLIDAYYRHLISTIRNIPQVELNCL